MRVSREKSAETRERILDVAARLFREKSFDGIGLADIMKAAGLTRGGFFGSPGSAPTLLPETPALAGGCPGAPPRTREGMERGI